MNISKFKQIMHDHVHMLAPKNEDFINEAKLYFSIDNSHPSKTSNFAWSRLIISITSFIFLFFLTTTLLMGTLTKATVTLDINPSVTIKLNYFHRVIAIEAINPEAEELLQGISTGNKTAPEIVEELYAKAIELEYLSESSNNVILLGISANSYTIEQEFEATFAAQIDQPQFLFLNYHTSDSSLFPVVIGSPSTTSALPSDDYPFGSIYDSQSGSLDEFKNNQISAEYTTLSEAEFLEMAAEYQVSPAKLQMAIAVFNGYGNYTLIQDLEFLLSLPIADLLALYQGISE
ncbi:MAG: hypothetical protein PHT27_04025 [Candidatus Izemoplasmatales bacterium]|nr:hypothetical protein [Candidatus Izemoplasmatales bacterium]